MGNRFDAFLRRLLQVETVCAVLILSTLIALISCQVFLRYVFNNPFTWAEELGALLLIYLSFVTGDIVYKKNAHISIDYLVGFFPPRVRAAIQIALAAMICICLASLMVVSLPLIHDQLGYTIAAALPLSKSWWTMPVPTIFLSMILTTVNVIIHQAGKFPNGGRRTNVPISKIPANLKLATIATEDPSFYSNPGVDARGIARAVYYLATTGKASGGGGSTITQQLVRNTLISPEPTIERKIREAILALEVTRRYTKDQILELYLNTIPFGNLAYGIEAASQAYFNKHAEELTLPEASLLAGVPQAPALWDPCVNPDAALRRQRVVLDLMADAGYLPRDQIVGVSGETSRLVNSDAFTRRCAQGIGIKAPHFVDALPRARARPTGARAWSIRRRCRSAPLVVSALKARGEPQYIEGVLQAPEVAEMNAEGGQAGGEADPLYDQAVDVVLKNRRASISLVQRHLRIGYNRAARLLEDMEKAGMVSPMQSNGNREILVPHREAS